MTRSSLSAVPRLAALGLLTLACGTAPEPPPSRDLRDVEATIERLYRAFCFDAGGEADWEGMRAMFVEGAAFVAPVGEGRAPRAVAADEFLADFRAWVRSPEMAEGLHERILHTRIDLFGHVAHAWVAFEGHAPGEDAARTRGLDTIQLVRDGEDWKLVSFATQYAREGDPLPARFAP